MTCAVGSAAPVFASAAARPRLPRFRRHHLWTRVRAADTKTAAAKTTMTISDSDEVDAVGDDVPKDETRRRSGNRDESYSWSHVDDARIRPRRYG